MQRLAARLRRAPRRTEKHLLSVRALARSERPSRIASIHFLCVLMLWSVAVAVGFAVLMRYATTPGSDGQPSQNWPARSQVIPEPGRANLVLAVHPRCPCTRATIDELEGLATHCQGRLAMHLLFYRPADSTDDWDKTDLWRRAAAIPGAQVISDPNGTQASLFGAVTSGQALLYDPSGHLVFSGGITNTRGHAGDSAGVDAILTLLNHGTPERTKTPVYGCPLKEMAD